MIFPGPLRDNESTVREKHFRPAATTILQYYSGIQRILTRHWTQSGISSISPGWIHKRISSKTAESRVRGILGAISVLSASLQGCSGDMLGPRRMKNQTLSSPQITAGIQAPGSAADQSSCPPVIGNTVHFGGLTRLLEDVKTKRTFFSPGSVSHHFPSFFTVIHALRI